MDEYMPVNTNTWEPTKEQLADMTPLKARDLLVECFYTAQLEAFKCIKKACGEPMDETHIRQSVKQGILYSFKEVGIDFDEPDKAGLVQVVEFLTKAVPVWGSPDAIAKHHRQMMEIVERL